MKKRILFLTLAALSCVASAAVDEQTTIAIAQSIPNTKIVSIDKSPIDGLYSVYTGSEVLYVEPNNKLVFFGRVYRSNGSDITAEELKMQEAKYNPSLTLEEMKKVTTLKEFVDSSAIVDKKSKYTLVMFTNPHCGHCNQAEAFLKNAKINKYYNVLGNPVEAVKYYSNTNPATAYETHDASAAETEKGRAMTQKAQELARKYRVSGTPTFFVFESATGKLASVIKGANKEELQKYFDGEVR